MRTFVETVVHSSALLCACFTMLRANTVGPPIGEAYDRFGDLANCGKTFGCIRTPQGCEPKDCDVLVTWKVNPTKPSAYLFEIGGRNVNNDFLAISFCLSKDAAVGDDSCMVCEYNGYVTTALSYVTPAGANELITDAANVLEFEKLNGVFFNKYVWCKASRPITFSTFNSKLFDLSAAGAASTQWNSYYPIIASQKIFDGVWQPATERVIWPESTPLNVPIAINGAQHLTILGILPLLAVISHLL